MDRDTLINLLMQEPPGTDILLVDPDDQAMAYDFTYVSRVQGTTEVPVKLALLTPDFDIHHEY